MNFFEKRFPNVFPEEIFASLVGKEYDFYGVDGNSFCIGYNGTRIVLEAIEDESDGYRSYFGCFKTLDDGKIFFKNPIAKVRLEEGGFTPTSDKVIYDLYKWSNFRGWSFIDVNTQHIWLIVGTNYLDSYYPCFIFDYSPDTSKLIF